MTDNTVGMGTQPAVSTVEHAGFTVDSSDSEEVVRESLKTSTAQPKPSEAEKDAKPGKPDLSKAASELGKKGGKAAAKARQEREAEPEPAKEQTAKPAVSDADADDADETTDATETPEAASTGEGKPRNDPKARIAQLARERNEEREKRQRVEQELAAERRAKAQAAPQPERTEPRRQEERPGLPPKPQPNEYETHDQYLDARDAWNQKQWESSLVARVNAHREATTYARKVEGVAQTWQQRLQGYAKADPEFPDRAKGALNSIGFPSDLLPHGTETTAANWIADYLTSAGDSTRDLLLHLSENESDLQRIITLEAPHAVARELAMIEASLKRPSAVTTDTSAGRVVSRANPPVTSVTGSPTIAEGDAGPKPGESFDQWYARTGKTQKP